MKYTALILMTFAVSLKAELPAGATDLVPRINNPAIECLKMKDKIVARTSCPEITFQLPDFKSLIEVPSVYISNDSKSEKKR